MYYIQHESHNHEYILMVYINLSYQVLVFGVVYINS